MDMEHGDEDLSRILKTTSQQWYSKDDSDIEDRQSFSQPPRNSLNPSGVGNLIRDRSASNASFADIMSKAAELKNKNSARNNTRSKNLSKRKSDEANLTPPPPEYLGY